MWAVTSQKNGASAMGLQRVLGLGSYDTAWTWLHKLLGPGLCSVDIDPPTSGAAGRGHATFSGLSDWRLLSTALLPTKGCPGHINERRDVFAALSGIDQLANPRHGVGAHNLLFFRSRAPVRFTPRNRNPAVWSSAMAR